MDVRKDAEFYGYKAAGRVLRSPKLRAWLGQEMDMDLGAAKSAEDVLAAIARRRGLYLKGGDLNIAEAARALLRALREAPEL